MFGGKGEIVNNLQCFNCFVHERGLQTIASGFYTSKMYKILFTRQVYIRMLSLIMNCDFTLINWDDQCGKALYESPKAVERVK